MFKAIKATISLTQVASPIHWNKLDALKVLSAKTYKICTANTTYRFTIYKQLILSMRAVIQWVSAACILQKSTESLLLTQQNWAQLQQTYYEQLNSRRTGSRWTCSLFSELVKIPWELWRHRCRVQQLPHSIGMQDEHRGLNAAIQEEYDIGTLGWRQRDCRWFQRPSTTIFDEPLSYKFSWLHSVSIARERHLRRLLTPQSKNSWPCSISYFHQPQHCS